MKYGYRVAALIVASIPLVLLTGCTFGLHYAILDREAEPADTPPELSDHVLDDIDIDTVRFATEYAGERLYLAKTSDPNGGICLLIDAPGADGVSTGCSLSGSWFEIEGRYKYHVHPDGTPLPGDEYTDLTENVSVKTG